MSEAIYIVGHERGFNADPLPIWSDAGDPDLLFEAHDPEQVSRRDIPEVPGAFQLLNVLSSSEADNFVRMAEQMGFDQDSPVSLPHNVRHNHNVNWIVSEAVDSTLWARSRHLVTDKVDGESAKGLNARFRFYRYETGDFFKPHSDGAWPGSRVIDNRIVQDAYPGLMSQYTYLIFLSDGYEGGRTEFLVSKSNPGRPAQSRDDVTTVSVSTPKGGVLCFPHGQHPLHCIHSGELITSGAKYIIRSDILY
ncbi:oxidoreductase [Larsenimonas rhizosphaerae]|uniref:Oxidoreductase n=1 Tax=Larsenimonas rhizosphaerae TaxID=2944682 RepID=A0AA42CUD4_9GAMM|nr:oxidoreductase [Larsenimonas rhizosphaerae]MCM2129538.1 oxidoreductase [Larsenimonas rhizosphaerae]MCX2524194.1 oxidoreductase [Larsenimonas rhizosphaerae]